MQNNLLFELIPLIVFFALYYLTKNIFLATAACIIASWLQIIICKITDKKISKNLWLSTLLITFFGGLTIILQNKTFIMLKPTVLYWIVATSILIGQLLGKNIIKITLEKEIALHEDVWKKLNIAWGLFFIAMGALNLFIAFNYSEYMWVKFKVFGSIILLLVFIILSSLYIYTSKRSQK